MPDAPAETVEPLPDGDLVEHELAEYERWAGASLHVGGAGSTQRAAFLAEAMGQGVLVGGATGAAMGFAGTVGGRALSYGITRGLSSALSSKLGGKFVPVPGVGSMIGGAIALGGLVTRDWSATGAALGRMGTGTTEYERLANTLAGLAELLDVVGNVVNVLAGVIGAAAVVAWALTVFTAGVASPLAGTLSTLAIALGLAGDALSIIGSMVLQPLSMMFRTLHAFTSDADPRQVEEQGGLLTTSAAATAGQLGGLAGGFLGKRVPAPARFRVPQPPPPGPHPHPAGAAAPTAGSAGAPPKATGGRRAVGAQQVHPPGNHPAAVRDFETWVRQDPTRECGVWHNPKTGESVVVQGEKGSVPYPQVSNLRDWQITDHYHPGRGARRVAAPIDVVPSGEKGDLGVVRREAGAAGAPRGSRVHYPAEPGAGGRWGSTDFGYDPGQPRPFWVEGPFGPHGERQKLTFKTAKEFDAWSQAHQEYGNRGGPGRQAAAGAVAKEAGRPEERRGVPGSGGFWEGFDASVTSPQARTAASMDAAGTGTSERLAVNPQYTPPPGTAEQLGLYLAERARLRAERERARAVERHMSGQQQHHAANTGPIDQAVTNTGGGVRAAEAHSGAVGRTGDANTQQQNRESEAGSVISGYPSRAAGLATLKTAVGGFIWLTDQFARFGDYPGRGTIEPMNRDSKKLSTELGKVDAAMAQQAEAQPGRTAALSADAARIAEARRQATAATGDLNRAHQGATALQDENQRRVAEAARGRDTAAREGAQLDQAADGAQAAHDALAAQLLNWAQAQRAARRAAFARSHAMVGR